MDTVSLFDLASQNARWLAARQSAVASNIANANTPGYVALDVVPFSRMVEGGSSGLHATHVRHFGTAQPGEGGADRVAARPVGRGDERVSLESELVRSGQVKRSYELNAAIVGAFHGMIMQVTRT